MPRRARCSEPRALNGLRETVAETGSTSDDLRVQAAAGAAEGTWLRAERQTCGHGRLGREWHSPAGNLYASTLVRLRGGDPPAPTLALVAAVALDEAIGGFAEPAVTRIKWPNDLLLRRADAWAKVAGILLERSGDAVVIGFGVNLARAPAVAGRAVASLADVTGWAVEPGAFMDVLADALARWLAVWRGQGLTPVRTRWTERAHPPGTPLIVRTADGAEMPGLFEGLDADGALRLRTAERVVTVTAGDVFLL